LGPQNDRPLTRGERWAEAIIGIVIFGLFTAEVVVNFHPVKLSILFFVLWWIPLLAFHEAGHALTALGLGWRVGRVVLGIGRPVLRFQWGRVGVEVRMFPISGFTRLRPRDLRAPRLKNFLIYAAGPGAEILAVGLLLLVLGYDRLVTQTDSIPIIAAQSFAIAAATGVVTNLIPMTSNLDSGETANDGMGMLVSLTTPRAQFEAALKESMRPDE
jgi:hypothetical protein